MSEPAADWISDPRAGRKPGQLGELETWWAERQIALERAGYMLRPRYRPDWEPSWTGTDKFYLDCEDGQPQRVSVYIPLSTNRAESPPAPPGHGCDQDL